MLVAPQSYYSMDEKGWRHDYSQGHSRMAHGQQHGPTRVTFSNRLNFTSPAIG